MRREEFKMERTGLLEVADHRGKTSGFLLLYTWESICNVC
jgi:hypothetical protein